MLSAQTERRLQLARQNETTYRPNDAIAAQLSQKTLVLFVGPVAIGKSFIVNAVAETSTEFSRVPIFTTREARADDEPGMFHTYPHDDASVTMLLDKIEAREVVQYVVHPTSGRIYGSTIDGYASPILLFPALSNIVDSMRQLPFKSSYVIGLATNPDIWKNRLEQRYPVKNEEYTKRIKEAISSLNWLLAPEQAAAVHWVNNTANPPTEAIQSVINIVKYGYQGDLIAREYAQAMLAQIAHNLQT